MGAAQRKRGLVVIKVGKTPDGLPAGECVAVVAANFQISMRTMRRSALRRLREAEGRQREQEEQAKDTSAQVKMSHKCQLPEGGDGHALANAVSLAFLRT